MKTTLKTLIAAGCLLAAGSTLAAEHGLRFGVEALYPPFESKSASGQLEGFDIDLGNAVCAAARLQCSWVETSFDSLIPALQARKFDVINSAMNVTEQRKQAIGFTKAIYQVPNRLIARADSGLTPNASALAGKRVGVLQGSIQENYAKAHWAPQGVEVVAYQDQNQVYLDLTAGRLDATLIMAPAGQSGFLAHPDGKGFAFVGDAVQDEKIFGSGIAFGLRKDDQALKQRLDAAIAQVQQQGTVQALAKKYFGDIDVTVK
ncbi:ABC transporter substrate-binding protein [Serratia sp. AKBS12]|uniref:ABC transporter substrate-binding protein n=1 Tax=Serratia sp. AKBS12 TaxID=2974597 RepID=UPI00216602D5|nr:ABC transporter substrate-binding protein [Serratia sp. AKBS12]MCS3409544.1 ABC transporter substrate-binding protein [Serratia sp. AKBS12]HEI8865858.1 ABC transporter substrate-binding protein [Serratia odorifera]